MTFRAPDDGLNAGHKLILVEWLGQIVIGAKPEAFDLVLDRGEARKYEDWRLDLGNTQGPQNLIARDVGKVQFEQDNIVVVKLAALDAGLSEIRRIDVKIIGFVHHIY